MVPDARTLTTRILREICNDKTPALIPKLYSDDCVIHTPDGEVHGAKGGQHLYETYTAAFPDGRFEVLRITA